MMFCVRWTVNGIEDADLAERFRYALLEQLRKFEVSFEGEEDK